jgi:hypothetical protein
MKVITKEQLYTLFVNRKDVFSQQIETGAYIPVRREITMDDIEKHLKGEMTIGLYALDTDNKVKWACIDLDGIDLDQLKAEAIIIYNQFKDFPRMLEFSGRRGYHVWIFFKTRVTADYAQKMVKARLNRVGLGNYEVFPKQTTLNENRSYGNLVKLPMAKHKLSGKYSEILLMEV